MVSPETGFYCFSYFGTLATVLDVLRQDAQKHGYKTRHQTLFQELREDLMYLRENYQIMKQRKETKIASVEANQNSLYVP